MYLFLAKRFFLDDEAPSPLLAPPSRHGHKTLGLRLGYFFSGDENGSINLNRGSFSFFVFAKLMGGFYA